MLLQTNVFITKLFQTQVCKHLQSSSYGSISHHCLSSNSTALYGVTGHRARQITFANKNFSCYEPKLWNLLSERIKTAASIHNLNLLLFKMPQQNPNGQILKLFKNTALFFAAVTLITSDFDRSQRMSIYYNRNGQQRKINLLDIKSRFK